MNGPCVTGCVRPGLVESWALLQSSLQTCHLWGGSTFESTASFHNLDGELRIQEIQLAGMSQSSSGIEKQESIHAGSEQGFGALTRASRENPAQRGPLGSRKLPRTETPSFCGSRGPPDLCLLLHARHTLSFWTGLLHYLLRSALPKFQFWLLLVPTRAQPSFSQLTCCGISSARTPLVLLFWALGTTAHPYAMAVR